MKSADKRTSAATRRTEGQRLDQAKRDARTREAAKREKEGHSPSDYQKKVILANVERISEDLKALTEAGIEDKTTVVRREVMRFLLFFKRRCEQERRRVAVIEFDNGREPAESKTEETNGTA